MMSRRPAGQVGRRSVLVQDRGEPVGVAGRFEVLGRPLRAGVDSPEPFVRAGFEFVAVTPDAPLVEPDPMLFRRFRLRDAVPVAPGSWPGRLPATSPTEPAPGTWPRARRRPGRSWRPVSWWSSVPLYCDVSMCQVVYGATLWRYLGALTRPWNIVRGRQSRARPCRKLTRLEGRSAAPPPWAGEGAGLNGLSLYQQIRGGPRRCGPPARGVRRNRRRRISQSKPGAKSVRALENKAFRAERVGSRGSCRG